MATKRMLIDAAHPEEIRVAVMDGNQLEELDVESAARRQLKSNIYLAKVTRVEPSLQAAFVDYGGNRHGFLAFREIHPDYYQIPVADREELLAEELAASDNDDADDDIDEETSENGNDQENDGKTVETVGGDDIDEVETRRKFFPAKRYKIQEVIKRRQILLVQVVKEERGNKGAALTTYMSLAGRYCVLMPNTGKGGGISRKISNGSDRKRLKTIISDFDIPDGMAVIVRTAGADRSKAEIKRDYEYLIKLWSSVRDLTLESTAPAMIHEEASIIKRAVRDHYSRDVAEVIVEGEEGYRTAKDLMKMLIPSHAKKVQPYKDTTVPLFNRYHIESQLETMNSANVQLKSGGYIVINITEALVAVDVNSGRATRGRNIEETALKTNLEAANEVARQLRLRDLAGLVVIDFIDMEIHRNQTAVEHRLKEAMRKDRA
ncbi:MAG TPA: Rne/Rng family ribonuclease, partial [Rhodospirillales bacterium]|nr:Rne/Rng family ribonuclease [Rhodospirillales bacterium]